MDLACRKWQLWILKGLDRERYCTIKDERYAIQEERARIKMARKFQDFSNFTFQSVPGKHPLVFKHSGNSGDIIYALPAVQALAGASPARFQVALDVPMVLAKHHLKDHPLGNVMMNRKMFDLLAPLLAAQPYIEHVEPYDGKAVDFDLDIFRKSPLPLDRFNISRWYFYFLGVTQDLSVPWLHVKADDSTRDKILLARSARYRNLALDYRFLARRKDLLFVGVEREYLNLRQCLPGLEWLEVRDFLHLAEVIAGCRLFIGNQSFPYSIAEGLKIPRLLEVDPMTPNVMPAGNNACELLFQRQFEHLVKQYAPERASGAELQQLSEEIL